MTNYNLLRKFIIGLIRVNAVFELQQHFLFFQLKNGLNLNLNDGNEKLSVLLKNRSRRALDEHGAASVLLSKKSIRVKLHTTIK